MQPVPLVALSDAVLVADVSPLATAAALAGAALSDAHRRELPAGLRRALQVRLRRRDRDALRPLADVHSADGSGRWPTELVPLTRGLTFDEQLDAVGLLVAAADAWRDDYVDAMWRTWGVVEPIWRRAASLLDREIERVSVALAHGAGPELIVRLLRPSRIQDGALLLPGHDARQRPARAGATILLQPLVAPASAAGWVCDACDTCQAIRYPAPAAWRVLADDGPPLAELSALIGPQRARLLRSLERPARAGQLADVLRGPPSMVTHHLSAMERAGLVTRMRDGRHVWVHRSARGSELVALYERRG